MLRTSDKSFYVGGVQNYRKKGTGIEVDENGWTFAEFRQDQIQGYCELYDKQKKCSF